MADDLGYNDLSPRHTLNQTTSISRLASEGMTFTNAYSASSVCSPTRACLLTGKYPARLDFTRASGHTTEEVLQSYFTPDDRLVTVNRLFNSYYTLGEAMRDGGYETLHVGKWHLGRPPYVPKNHGFSKSIPNTWAAGPPGGYIGWDTAEYHPDPPKQHIEDRMVKEIETFLRNRDTDKPFFINYWMFSVHGPFEAKQPLVDTYWSKELQLQTGRSPTYAAMVKTMDVSVGTLLNLLVELNLDDETIVIFTSDNGGNVHTTIDGDRKVTNNSPLRGGKGTLYEGGERVPLIIKVPGLTQAGSSSNVPVHTIDFYPTLMALTGVSPVQPQTFDGVNLKPILAGTGTITDRALFSIYTQPQSDGKPPGVSVRFAGLKMIRYFNPNVESEVYDLVTDQGETTNIYDYGDPMVEVMDDMIDTFLEDTNVTVPTY